MLQVLVRVILPYLYPAWLTGFALAFARAVGEYGSVVFISGNMPMRTEITPLLIITKLEQFDYAGATAIALVMLLHLLRPAVGDQCAAGLEREAALGRLSHVWQHTVARGTPEADRAALLVRWALTAVVLLFLTLFLVVPLVTVFVEAFAKGSEAYLDGGARAGRAGGAPA